MRDIQNKIWATVKSPQFLRFAGVGVANTAIDFIILNILTESYGWQRINANIVSTSLALTFSFMVNSQAVFPGGSRSRLQQALLFAGVTLTGLYGLQSGAIYFLTEVWTWPLDLVVDITGLNQDMIYTNVSKLAASSLTLTWNFILYKKLVFSKEKEESADE